MAGWILYNKGLDRKPQVVRTMSALRVDKWRAVGAWLTLWEWADDVTEDGFVPHVSPDDVDAMIGLPGFFAVGVQVGWLAQEDGGIRLVGFTEYNTDSAKKRAKDAKRKARTRVSSPQTAPVRDLSATSRTERGQMSEVSRTNRGATEHNSTEQNSSSSTLGIPGSSARGEMPAAAAAEASPEEVERQRQYIQKLVLYVRKRPEWLPEAKPWLDENAVHEIARLPGLTQEIWNRVVRDARESRHTLRNPAGYFRAQVLKACGVSKRGGAA